MHKASWRQNKKQYFWELLSRGGALRDSKRTWSRHKTLVGAICVEASTPFSDLPCGGRGEESSGLKAEEDVNRIEIDLDANDTSRIRIYRNCSDTPISLKRHDKYPLKINADILPSVVDEYSFSGKLKLTNLVELP